MVFLSCSRYSCPLKEERKRREDLCLPRAPEPALHLLREQGDLRPRFQARQQDRLFLTSIVSIKGIGN